jgi:hypothetical protein
MTWEEFEKAHNFRLAEKCCFNCKHGDVQYEGECGCDHPLVKDEGPSWTGGSIADVCDLWEKKGGAE